MLYATFKPISAYIREKGFKSHVYKFKHVFRDDVGNIKGIKKVHGVQRVYRRIVEGNKGVIH